MWAGELRNREDRQSVAPSGALTGPGLRHRVTRPRDGGARAGSGVSGEDLALPWPDPPLHTLSRLLGSADKARKSSRGPYSRSLVTSQGLQSRLGCQGHVSQAWGRQTARRPR